MPSRKGKGYENKAKNLYLSDLKNKKVKAITRVKTCSQHSYELNWSDLQQLDPFYTHTRCVYWLCASASQPDWLQRN